MTSRKSSPPDEALLRNPWVFGATTTLALIFLASNVGEAGTGQATTVLEAIGIGTLVLAAIILVWQVPRMTGRPPHRVVILRCCIAAVPYIGALIATRWGAPQWPPGITLILFVGLMVFSLRQGRRILANA